MIGIIIAIIALVGAGVGAYFLFIKKKPAAITTTPATPTGWQFQYSSNVAGTPEDFDFPQQDGVHYCVKTPPPLAIGQTITMKFSITGTGTLKPVQGTDAYVTLYIQRKGDNMSAAGQYQQYRYWSSIHPKVSIGEYIISIPLNAEEWSDVYGKPGTDFQAQFLACIANCGAIGFTFGDPTAGATGHGVYANGPVHFHLNEFTII